MLQVITDNTETDKIFKKENFRKINFPPFNYTRSSLISKCENMPHPTISFNQVVGKEGKNMLLRATWSKKKHGCIPCESFSQDSNDEMSVLIYLVQADIDI